MHADVKRSVIWKKGIKALVSAVVMTCLISVSIPVLGCGGESSAAQTKESAPQAQTQTQAETTAAKDGTYVTPDFRDAQFHQDLAETDGTMYIDVSAVNEGYVAASGKSGSKLKFQVIYGDTKYNYDLPKDGTPKVYPLQSGNGEYHLRIMENTVDSKYAVAFETTVNVVLDSEFEPYLRPSIYCDYSKTSECVKKCAEFAAKSDSVPEIITHIYDFVCSTVTYDYEKAASMETGYYPVPDETMRTGKGICLDYAALAAAMMRSQGIPTKLIFGYVAPDDLYHAWNMFYTEETGWVSVEFKISEKNWNRLDLTFSANGSDSSYIGNGSNYADVYQY